MVFLSKLGDLQKKSSSPKFKGFCRPKSETQGFVSGRNQKLKGFFRPNAGDLQQKKGLHRNSKDFFCRNQKLKGFFWPKSGDLQKIGLHRLWVNSWTKKLHYSGPNNAKSFTTSAPKSLWGGELFSFLEQKSASKALETCFFAYFSGQWGRLEPLRPPLWLRYRSIVDNSYILIYSLYIYFVSLSTANKPTTLKLANFVCSWCLGRS